VVVAAVLAIVLAVVALSRSDDPAGPRDAPQTRAFVKSIWGPVDVAGASQFPIYAQLGVGLWQTVVRWDEVAAAAPSDPDDPADLAYRWPERVDEAIREGRRHGIEVGVLLLGAPPWANGGHAHWSWSPTSPRAFARFAAAASRRWPQVTHWMVWGEPNREDNFKPLTGAPRRYAQLLDATYAALKSVQSSDVVVGGNTYTIGDISPRRWIRALRLPDGQSPRMDLWGHNPFTARKPDLSKPPLRDGVADFSDLDTLWGWLDRWQRRGRRDPLRIFISELTWQTDRSGSEFNFYVTRDVQARWLRAALKIARSSPRIASLGWLTLRDEPPAPDGDELRFGLIDADGTRKPAFRSYAQG
jgi:hypothetical protein